MMGPLASWRDYTMSYLIPRTMGANKFESSRHKALDKLSGG